MTLRRIIPFSLMLLSLNGASASVVHNTSMDDNSAVIVAPRKADDVSDDYTQAMHCLDSVMSFVYTNNVYTDRALDFVMNLYSQYYSALNKGTLANSQIEEMNYAFFQNGFEGFNDQNASNEETYKNYPLLYYLLDAWEIKKKNVDEYRKVTNYFKVNTWSNEVDPSNPKAGNSSMTTPFLEYWTQRENGGLDDATIHAKVVNLDAGLYTVRFLARVANENNDVAPKDFKGVTMYVTSDRVKENKGVPLFKSKTIDLCNGVVHNDGGLNVISQVYELDSIIIREKDNHDADIFFTIKDANVNWLSWKNFQFLKKRALNYLEENGNPVDVEKNKLKDLITYLGSRRIGFEKGEYAPFNNREVIKTYKEARQYLESTTENDADYEKLQKYVDVLCDTVNTWKKNAERVNAIYNPSFSLVKPNNYNDLPGWAIHDETVPTPRMGLSQCTSVTSSSDWDMFDNAKGSVNLDGEENTFSTAAKFVFENNALDFCSTRSVYSYGDEDGYELPLVPGKTYKFSAQVGNCGTKGTVTFDVYNARTGKFIGFTECEPQVCLFEHSERPEEIYFTFKTGAVDDYDNTLKNYSEHENYRLVMRNSNVNAVWSLVMSNLSLKMLDEPGEKTDTIKIDVTTPVGNELQNVTVQQIDLPDEDDCESTVYSAIDESKDMIVTFKVPVDVVLSDNKYYIVITMRPVCGSRARPSYLEFGLKGVPTRLQTKAPAEDEEYMSLGQYVYTGEKEETFVLEYNGTDDITDASVVITSKAPEDKEHESSIAIKDISLVSGNNITGIRHVRQTKTDVPSGIYTIQGTRINSIRKGMNLVRMNDGTFRKIIY